MRQAERAATPPAGRKGLALCPPITQPMQAIVGHQTRAEPGLTSTLLAMQSTQLFHRWLSASVRQAGTHPAGQVGHIDAQQRLELLRVQEEPAWRLQAVVGGGGPGLGAQGMLEAARQARQATCSLCLLRLQVNGQVSTCRQRPGIQCRVSCQHWWTAVAHTARAGA